MTSKLIVNNIGSDTGINTVTFDSNVARGTSNLHSVGVEVAGINVLGGDTKIGAGATVYNTGDVKISGISTANTFYGDGSNLTGINATQLSGTLPDGRFPANLPVIGGANITGIPTTGDINRLETNIAVLGFKIASNNDLNKYNLQDQYIDEFEDASGVDAGASTNETLSNGVYSGTSRFCVQSVSNNNLSLSFLK